MSENCPVDWKTPGLIERLKELYAQRPSRTTRWIAMTLHTEFGLAFTRNSIIGKVARLGLPLRDDAPKNANPPQRARVQSLNPARPPSAVQPKVKRQLRSRPVSFGQLGQRHCKWPLRPHPNPLFCGQPRLADYPYCAEHWEQAHERRR